jgi:carbamoyl-phosphate synthase large subunit
MRSTGEVMGISERFSIAFAKSQLSAGVVLPQANEGLIFLSVTARHKDAMAGMAKRLSALGYQLIATKGTAQRLEEEGIEVTRVKKLAEGHPNLIDYMIDGKVKLVMNTPSGKGARTDEGKIRAKAVEHGVPIITTIQAAEAAVKAMEALREEDMAVQPVQERFATVG